MACADNKSIAFISGNFNVVHPGHLRLLKFAAEQADVVVVGVNSDTVAGVTLPLDVRVENVRSISMVDHVVGLVQDQHLHLGRKLLPATWTYNAQIVQLD